MTIIKDIIVHTFTVQRKYITIVLIHYVSTHVQIHKQRVEGEQRECHYTLHIIHPHQTSVGGRHGHLKASQFVLTEPENQIFLCRLNARRTDQTAA